MIDVLSMQISEHDEHLKLQLSVLSGLNQKASEVIKNWQKMQSKWAEEDVKDVGQKLHTVTGRYYSEEEIEDTLENGSPELIYRQALSENVSGATVNPHPLSLQFLVLFRQSDS